MAGDPATGRRACTLAAVAMVAALCAPGCAITTMTLETPPHARVTMATSVGEGREIALVVPFADRRATPQRCGMKKNGYNMDTADILCAEPPNQWLAALLAEELRKAGFRVAADPRQAGPGALRLEGTLTQFFLEPDVGFFTFSPEADIELRLVASAPSGLVAERRFYCKGRETALSGLEENFRLAADSAVRDMLVRVVAAVAELVRQYPDIGLPPRVGALAARRTGGEVAR
ncbi:MAG TPA: hypothetical protein VF516_08045 [Kofleriaceae bacterium]